MTPPDPDHYTLLGLGRRCSLDQVRMAYRVLVQKHHPDRNGGSAESTALLQELNAAYEVLSDPDRRSEYDRELAAQSRPATSAGRIRRDLTQDVLLRIEDFLRGATLDVRINDPSSLSGPETYTLVVPPDTAPGERFRLPRDEAAGGGVVTVRVKARPDHRFKVRGSDLRCDLRISTQRAAQGGVERLPGATGRMIAVTIPPAVARGTIVRVAGEGMPKSRGGRGDLLVRITYRPEIRITRR